MIIAAKTGRRMQTSASFCKDGLLLQYDRLPAGEVAWFDHDRLARGEPLENFHPVARFPPGPDPLLHGKTVLDAEHLLDAGEGHDRRGRHKDGGAVVLDYDLRARECTGAQPAFPVRDLGLHDKRTVLFLDRRTQSDHAPVMLCMVTFRPHADRLPGPHIGRLTLRHRHPQARGGMRTRATTRAPPATNS